MSRVTRKVVCYVLRGEELLVLTHDDHPLTVTGVQVPAGTIEPGETVEAAARRELAEETGLRATAVHHLGTQEYDLRPARDERAVRHFVRVEVEEFPAQERWTAGETDPSDGGDPVTWTCWWLPVENAHVLAAGFGALIGRAVSGRTDEFPPRQPGTKSGAVDARRDPSPRAGTLISICAPPGTGKSAVLPHLIARARGRAVVADIDEVLEDGSLLGVRIADPSAAPVWPAYDRHWERIGRFVTRAGFDMVLFTQVPGSTPSPGAGPILGWEIEDDARAARLRNRQESEETVADARSDARALRALLPSAAIIRSDASDSPEACADALWSAVEPNLSSPTSP